MKRGILTLVLTVLVLFLPGCLEIAGQRLTLKYDAAKDQLHLLLQYEGIHDSGDSKYGNGARQLAEAVRDGTIMVIDWPGQIEWATLRKRLSGELPGELSPALREFLKAAIADVKVTPLGHHRDSKGRIGGTQHIVISNAKALINKANAALDANFVSWEDDPESRFARTNSLIRQTADKGGHPWLELDGNALIIRIPVHHREWAQAKAFIVTGMMDGLMDMTRNAQSDDVLKEMREFTAIIQALTCGPLSLKEEANLLTIRVGEPKATSTLRFDTGVEYLANLEEAVEKNTKSVDPVLAKLLLGGEVEEGDEAIAAVASWLPPEDRVRAVMAAVRGNDTDMAAKAVAWLEKFAAHWNENEALPVAPSPSPQTGQYLNDWAKWHQRMMRFPLPDEK